MDTCIHAYMDTLFVTRFKLYSTHSLTHSLTPFSFQEGGSVVEGLWCIGDANGKLMLAHTASAQVMVK